MKWTYLIRLSILISLTVFLLLGCAPQVATPSPGDIQTALAQTLNAQPSETIPPTKTPTRTTAPSPTTAQTSTPTTSPPISGIILAEFLNLRSGPSTFFEIINTFIEDTDITAIGRTPDSQWVQVEIELEDEPAVEGWMAVDFLELSGEVSNLPVTTSDEGMTIQGRIEDTEGNPIFGISIAVVLQNDQVDLRSDVTSNNEGEFEVYLPEDLFGTFDVQIVSWQCESPVADLNCQFSGYVQVIDRAFTTVPQEDEILFIYEKTDLQISGNVVDDQEEPVSQINIVAERDDGAVSFGISDALGDFSMPISEGTWEIYAVVFDPEFSEGTRINLEVTETNPDNVILLAP